jgi:hypothetical protein
MLCSIFYFCVLHSHSFFSYVALFWEISTNLSSLFFFLCSVSFTYKQIKVFLIIHVIFNLVSPFNFSSECWFFSWNDHFNPTFFLPFPLQVKIWININFPSC